MIKKIINWLDTHFSKNENEEIVKLNNTIQALKKNIIHWNEEYNKIKLLEQEHLKDIDKLNTQIESMQEVIQELNNQLNEEEVMSISPEEFKNSLTETQLFISFITGEAKQNICNVFKFFNDEWEWIEDNIVKKVKNAYHTNDDRVKGLMYSILKKFPEKHYMFDKDNYGKMEYMETDVRKIFERQAFDCDELRSVIGKCLIVMGIPENRWYGVTGKVRRNGYIAELHAYIMYCSEKDNQWYPIEGTFYPMTAIDDFNINPLKNNKYMYDKPQYIFNDKKVYKFKKWL